MEALIASLLSALVGGVVGYVTAHSKLRSDIDLKLMDIRHKVYPRAWTLTGQLPRRPRTGQFTYGQLQELSISLRDWFYDEGGMYLSGPARRAFSKVQDAILTMEPCQGDLVMSDEHYEVVRSRLSHFRWWLTRDLMSRSGSPSLIGFARRIPKELRSGRGNGDKMLPPSSE